MQTITENFIPNRIFDLEKYLINIYGNKKIGYFDIETTGFSPKNSEIYMIGFASKCENNSFEFIQWFDDTSNEEFKMLLMFREYIKKFDILVDFNGTTFDVPFIENRGKNYGLTFNFDKIVFIDLYKEIRPLKDFFKLNNLKQKSIEQFLGINREDLYDGGKLIEIYKKYVDTGSKNKEYLKLLQLHNHDDIIGLVEVSDILPYTLLVSDNYNIKSLEITKDGLVVKCKLSFLLKTKVIDTFNSITIKGNLDELNILIPIETDTLKFYYKNYKDYYYLISEDEVIHKSLADFVEKSNKQKATKENCYTKRTGSFIVQFKNIIEPEFKYKYKDKISFIEINHEICDSFINDAQKNILFKNYIEHIIKYVIKKKQ